MEKGMSNHLSIIAICTSETLNHPDTTPPKRICVIGAGPAGLAALKCITSHPSYISGQWLPFAYESRSDIGGVWYGVSCLFSKLS